MLKRRAPRWCSVDLYGLEVAVEHPDWQERAERERVWVRREEAARMVDEPDLQALIAGFDPLGGPDSVLTQEKSAKGASPSTSRGPFWRWWFRR